MSEIVGGNGETSHDTIVAMLVGPTYDIEPVCPLCNHQGASRVWKNDEGNEATVSVFLSWCAAHGVHAPIRAGQRCPSGKAWEEQGGRQIRCDGCRYWTHPSAFCKPTGPPYMEGR